MSFFFLERERYGSTGAMEEDDQALHKLKLRIGMEHMLFMANKTRIEK